MFAKWIILSSERQTLRLCFNCASATAKHKAGGLREILAPGARVLHGAAAAPHEVSSV